MLKIHRLYLRLAVLLIPFFTVMVALPRTQPYDDSALRAFLMPPDCPLPCFMGIHPGLTTVDDAITILQNHDWVKTVDLSHGNTQNIHVAWQWSGTQPPFFDEPITGLFGQRGGKVIGFQISIDVTMAEIWWLFQRPPLVEISDGMLGKGLILGFAYPEKGFMFLSSLRECAPLNTALTVRGWNSMSLRSVEEMAAGTSNFRDFTRMTFSQFSGRMGC